MKIAIASCLKYRDAWGPFLALFGKFWPNCPYEVVLVTDSDSPGKPWCHVVSDFAAAQTQPILLMQEDLFLTAPVQKDLIERALGELRSQNAAMVRLYPCPGANEEYGDRHFGRIAKGTAYRVSCQAAIWTPSALREIASHFETPAEFELAGTPLSDRFDAPFLAFKRDVHPWPMEYLCSAISRGKWNPDAITLCERHGIPLDRSMRAVA